MTKESNFHHSRIGPVRPTIDDCPSKANWFATRDQYIQAPKPPETPKITGNCADYVAPKTQYGVEDAVSFEYVGKQGETCYVCGDPIPEGPNSCKRMSCSDACQAELKRRSDMRCNRRAWAKRKAAKEAGKNG